MDTKKLSAVYSVTEAALYGIAMNIYQLYDQEKPPLSFIERSTFKFDQCEDEFMI
jgi:hypothetical protein